MERSDLRLILAINGGSSSIKFALFEAGDSLLRILEGRIERIRTAECRVAGERHEPGDDFSRSVAAPNHTVAVGSGDGLARAANRPRRVSRGWASRGAWRTEIQRNRV